jgi:RHS repeat-associated protein
VRLVINAQTGAVAQSIDYDAWGRVLAEIGAGFQPFGFAGGLYDADTKLVRFGARDYDPGMGRWTNKDPIGFAGQQGNQYLYVDGDPVNNQDPEGTNWVSDLKRALEYRKWARALDALLSKLNWFTNASDATSAAQCGVVLNAYKKAALECRREIEEACGGDEPWGWLEKPECEQFDGGMDERQVLNCVARKLPTFKADLYDSCKQ